MAASWGRVGALSGAAAMAGAAYGAHGIRRSDRDEYQKELFDIANRFHIVTSLALLATPHCRRPHLAGSLLLAGLGLFCGPFYYHGLTGDPQFNRGAPLGGVPAHPGLGCHGPIETPALKNTKISPKTAKISPKSPRKYPQITKITQNHPKFNRGAPVRGSLLILGWAAMAL